MANKRSLKRVINGVCEELLIECVAASLYGNDSHQANADALMLSILKIQRDFVARVSHPEPGMKAHDYYKALTDKFTAEVGEVSDHINNL